MQVRLASPHFQLEIDHARNLVRLARTSTAFANADEMDRSFTEVLTKIERVDRARSGLVVDLRAAPMKNDPLYQVGLTRRRKQLHAGFARVAIVVKTPVGKLQVDRHKREASTTEQSFDDEAAAIAYASGARQPRA